MTAENTIIFIILGVALLLFISEKLRVDLVALIVLVSLTLTGLISPEDAFSGFASPAVIAVWSVFIISGGLTRSGVADVIARFILRLAGNKPNRLLILIMITAGVMSAFMNNIGAVAILLPTVVSVAREMKISPSKFLIPLAWSSLLGGNITLIGTPPNILAAAILETYEGIPNFTFFDFAPMGLIVLITGVLYMVFMGRRLLPERTPGTGLSQDYPVREYLTEVKLKPGSDLLGKTVREIDWGEVNVLHIISPAGEILSPESEHWLQVNDILLVESSAEELLQVTQTLDIVPVTEGDQGLSRVPDGSLELAEVILSPKSRLTDKSLAEIDFKVRYGLSVLALRHNGETLFSRIAEIPLQFGDSLLVEGKSERLDLLRRDTNFLLLDTQPPLIPRRTHKAPLTVAILLGGLVVVILGVLPVPVALLIGAILMVLTGALRMDEAYQSVDWKSVFLIAGMLPMGIAMEETGTAKLIADWIITLIGGIGPMAVLVGIYALTGLLTEVISNAAVTVLVTPIAIDAALKMGANPRAFVIGVVLAASTSFLMPIGHHVNVIIFGPGGYKFSDYTRVGAVLNLILLIVVLLTLPLVWPLTP